jgi:transposase-like protein
MLIVKNTSATFTLLSDRPWPKNDSAPLPSFKQALLHVGHFSRHGSGIILHPWQVEVAHLIVASVLQNLGLTFVVIFPHQASCLRLVSAVLNEISDEWLTGRTYLPFQEPALPAPVPQAQVSL